MSSKKFLNFKVASVYFVNYLLAFVLFVFIFANAIALYYKKPIPFVTSLIPYNADVIVGDLIQDFERIGNRDLTSKGQQYIKPEFMRIFRNDIKMPIDEEYVIAGKRWIRPFTAHFTILNSDSEGNPGDILIYMKSNWRTIPNPSVLTTGTNITVESIGAGAVDYKVAENYSLKSDERYLATGSDSRQLILLIENDDGNYSIIRSVSELIKT